MQHGRFDGAPGAPREGLSMTRIGRRRQQVPLLARDQARAFALDPDPDPLPDERRQLLGLPATSVVDIVSSQDVV